MSKVNRHGDDRTSKHLLVNAEDAFKPVDVVDIALALAC